MYIPVVDLLAFAARFYSPSSTTSAPLPGPTRNPGFKWIRHVDSDLYLQGNPPRSASQAVLGDPSDGGQFLIAGGGLIQLTSKAPSYTITYFNTSNGAMTFEKGVKHPSFAGRFSWEPVFKIPLSDDEPPLPPEKALYWEDTSGDGTLHTAFMLCGTDVYVAFTGIHFDETCREVILTSLSTVDPELELFEEEIFAAQTSQ